MKDTENIDQHTKACRDCGQVKNVADFYADVRPNGDLYYRQQCKACQYARQKAARQSRRQHRNGPVLTITEMTKAAFRKPLLPTEVAVKMARVIVDADEKLRAMESDLNEARKMLSTLQSDYDSLVCARDLAIADMREAE